MFKNISNKNISALEFKSQIQKNIDNSSIKSLKTGKANLFYGDQISNDV